MIKQIRSEEAWEKNAKKLMQQIWKVKGSQLFHTAVDPKLYGINDYFEIVKKPMDFGLIRNKLYTNVYSNYKEFIADMDQYL